MRLNTPPPIKARHSDANGVVTREWALFYQELYKVLQSPEIGGLNMVGNDLYWMDQETPQVNHLLVTVP